MPTYIQGSTATLEALGVVDIDGNAIVDPSSVTFFLRDPLGVLTTIATGWTTDSMGNFYYDYQLSSSAQIGTWTYQTTIVGTPYTIKSSGSFYVKSDITNAVTD